MHPLTIKLFLAHGNPNALRTAEISNWSGKAIAAPRTELADLVKREELLKPGLYLLSGTDFDTGNGAVYIGEAEDVAKRLKGHGSKDFWNAVTVFVSKDDNLTKAHIRYLEGKLIELANCVDSLVVKNSVSSGAKLPESDAAEMDIFLEKCIQLLPVLGVADFNAKYDNTSDSQDHLYCRIKGLTATGKRVSSGFIVFADSQAVLSHRPSAKAIRDKREQLIDNGVLKQQGDYLVFTKDIVFSSPSTAGGVIRGANTNGLTSWKNTAGVNLKQIEEQQI